MSQELIERLAREAGLPRAAGKSGRDGPMAMWGTELRRFAALVAEQCALLADARAEETWRHEEDRLACAAIADAIRAKFKATP